MYICNSELVADEDQESDEDVTAVSVDDDADDDADADEVEQKPVAKKKGKIDIYMPIHVVILLHMPISFGVSLSTV